MKLRNSHRVGAFRAGNWKQQPCARLIGYSHASSGTKQTSQAHHQLLWASSKLPALDPSLFPPPTPEFFGQTYVSQNRPGHFRHLVSPASPYAWPAITRWSQKDSTSRRETLRGMLRDPVSRAAVVKVELAKFGRGYNADGKEWDLIRMPFGTFIESFICESLPWSSDSEPPVGYVAQQPFTDLGKALQADCPPLPHVKQGAKGGGEDWGRNLWVGGAGTFTPIHRDPYHNLFVQVVGHKRIHFFPPEASQLLHLNARGSQTNTSRVRDEAPLLKGIPAGPSDGESLSLDEAIYRHAASAAHVLLEPGDALFLPRGWFHCVASLSTSASINAWFR